MRFRTSQGVACSGDLPAPQRFVAQRLQTPPKRLTKPSFYGTIPLVVLDGELAVPCTRNPP